MRILLIIFIVFTLNLSTAQDSRIFVDELYSDWDNIESTHIDSLNDQITGNIDFRQLWISNDEN